ncbi:class I SAM-dependent methyltransferase [Methylobacterium sp. P31]
MRLLEIGIGGYEDPDAGGSSLKLWRDYFLEGHIYGLDIFPKNGLEEDRIHIIQGSQVDARDLAKVLDAPAGARYDIIIDDGSHDNKHVILTFEMLFPHLNSGGIYVIEDVQTSYWPQYGGTSADFDSALTTMGYFKRLADGLNWVEHDRPGYSPRDTDKSITGIHFHHNIIFIEKGDNTEPSNIVRNNRLASEA